MAPNTCPRNFLKKNRVIDTGKILRQINKKAGETKETCCIVNQPKVDVCVPLVIRITYTDGYSRKNCKNSESASKLGPKNPFVRLLIVFTVIFQWISVGK